MSSASPLAKCLISGFERYRGFSDCELAFIARFSFGWRRPQWLQSEGQPATFRVGRLRGFSWPV